jgi:hypothetical protein
MAGDRQLDHVLLPRHAWLKFKLRLFLSTWSDVSTIRHSESNPLVPQLSCPVFDKAMLQQFRARPRVIFDLYLRIRPTQKRWGVRR